MNDSFIAACAALVLALLTPPEYFAPIDTDTVIVLLVVAAFGTEIVTAIRLR